MQQTTKKITMADGTTRRPHGILIDILILVGSCYILADFMVLDLDDNGTDLILGRPFLATAGVSINVPKQKIKIRLRKTVVKLYVETVDMQPTVIGQKFVINDFDAFDVVHLVNEITEISTTERVLEIKEQNSPE